MKERGGVLVLLGVSGSGKTSLLNRLREDYNVDGAKKYTTRKRRGPEDDNDFIFCKRGEFPNDERLLIFESYGDQFAIQISKIEASLEAARLHVVIVGDDVVVSKLKEIFGEQLAVVFVYCSEAVLKGRLLSDPARRSRWDRVVSELRSIYPLVGVSDYVVDNSGEFECSARKLARLLGTTVGCDAKSGS